MPGRRMDPLRRRMQDAKFRREQSQLDSPEKSLSQEKIAFLETVLRESGVNLGEYALQSPGYPFEQIDIFPNEGDDVTALRKALKDAGIVYEEIGTTTVVRIEDVQ